MTKPFRTVTTTVATLALAGLVAAPLPSASAAPRGDYFVVNTQEGSSPIVDAGGAFASCTSVTDLSAGGEQIGPRKVLYFGDKEVTCAGDVVVIHYVAEMNFESGKRTSGYWYVVTEESTLPGATEGGGTVRGDNTRCTPAAPGGFCILDTFAGDVQ
ncbi:MAG: hypothetical protein ACTHKG_21195 [Nocardioides sp.]